MMAGLFFITYTFMFYLYILYSSQIDRFYVGHTSLSPECRLQKHLSFHKGFTAKAKDWEIVYTEVFQTKTEAINRELMIKKWKSKVRIKQLISSTQ